MDDPVLLHEFFERAARRWPDHCAIDVPPGSERPERHRVTYGQLHADSLRLGEKIRECLAEYRSSSSDSFEASVGDQPIVAVLLPRTSHYLYLSQLAILKSGAAYVCLDATFPDERLRFILEDSHCRLVLSDSVGRVRLTELGLSDATIVDATEPWDDLAVCSAGDPPAIAPGHLAYLVYTSGTTGRPKGVMIEHRSIANLVGSDQSVFRLGPGQRVAQGSSAAYDSSVEETWLALASGATLVVLDDETVRLGPDLVSWLRDEKVSVFCPPPTLLRATGCQEPSRELPDLELLYVGGEALPRDIADRWSRGRRMVNGYGPTECTVTVLRSEIEEGRPVAIGSPVSGNTAWSLDPDTLAELPDGEAGELCLGGVGLARGYRNDPELTAKKFVTHPQFGRIYRTGDLVRRDTTPTREFFFLGRIDSQVKVRGYRIELEAIESLLADQPGVREAACRVQGEGASALIAAHVVQSDRHAQVSFESLAEALRVQLPEYMIPTRFALRESLPTSVGGKLDRLRLPQLDGSPIDGPGTEHVEPRSDLEAIIAAAFADQLGFAQVSVEADFFDLGGDSLRAAGVITSLRSNERTASLTVRDVYEERTVAALARRTRVEVDPSGGVLPAIESRPLAPDSSTRGSPLMVSFLQGLWLLLFAGLGGPVLYFLAFVALPFLTRELGVSLALWLAPLLLLLSSLAYVPFSVTVAVLAKKVLIGRYQAGVVPVWGSFYLRDWCVQRLVRLVPWGLIAGTEFQCIALRALGAKIGRRVHIHRGVHFSGWDLLELGDDVTLGQDAEVRVMELEAGQLKMGPVRVGRGSTVAVRAGVSGYAELEDGAYLSALSWLPAGGRVPAGECWDGVPARPVGEAPVAPTSIRQGSLSPLGYSILAVLAGHLLTWVGWLPVLGLASLAIAQFDLDSERALSWLLDSQTGVAPWAVAAGLLVVGIPPSILMQALLLRALGPERGGSFSRWSLRYLRLWLKTGHLHSAGNWLSGTLFWPPWLRLAGMRIGRGCEVSTIVDTVPELVEIGSESFLADGIYLAGSHVHRGWVTLGPTTLGRNTFLGNHVVVPTGVSLPDDILVGISTPAKQDEVAPGTSWFGHPPFQLPRRDVVKCERRLTHEPGPLRFANRVFWESLRFALPVLPSLGLLAWFRVVAVFETQAGLLLTACLLTFAASMTLAVGFPLGILALKWILLGRVKPGQHPLWSCWCSRWDFLYVAWGQYASGVLANLEGSLFLGWYLRAMGSRIGKRVVLGRGFAQVVDPDMLHFEDGATVSCLFQAHTFEDRVLKVDRVLIRKHATVGSAAVLLYGVDIGMRTRVAPHSVVMKNELLLADEVYAGCPTRPVRAGR